MIESTIFIKIGLNAKVPWFSFGKNHY